MKSWINMNLVLLTLTAFTLTGCGSEFKGKSSGDETPTELNNTALTAHFNQALSLRASAPPTTKSVIAGTSWLLLGTRQLMFTTDGAGRIQESFLGGGLRMTIGNYRSTPCPTGMPCPAVVIESADVDLRTLCQIVSGGSGFNEMIDSNGDLQRNISIYATTALNTACVAPADYALQTLVGYSSLSGTSTGLGAIAKASGSYLFLEDSSITYVFFRN